LQARQAIANRDNHFPGVAEKLEVQLIFGYSYNKNGNMVSDNNKGITAITYNHLNLPQEITFDTGNKILYIYNAAGVKLQKQVIEGSDTTFTDYLGGFVYENDTLQFLQTSEGRVVKNPDWASEKLWAYQYNHVDHLGNVRLVFGEPVPITYTATMESEDGPFEEAVFEQVAETRQLDAVFNHTPGGNESSRLNVSSEVVGPAKSLAVFPGDTVKMEVYAKYTEPQATTYNGIVPGLAGEIAGAFGNPVVTEGGVLLSDAITTAFNGSSLFNSGDNTVPRAYLQYLLFDANYTLYQTGFAPITGNSEGTSTPFDLLAQEIAIDIEGYIYIYVTNESDDPNVQVYFDDLKITHTKGLIVQSTDYYPFGLEVEASSFNRVDLLGSDYLYNGKEIQTELDLNWYDYGARMYMPDIGRFSTIDRFGEKYYALTPYQYAASNPILFIDVNGDSIIVNGDKEFVNAIANSIQKLTNQKVSVNEKGVISVTGKLEDESGKINLGTAIVSTLISSENMISISEVKGEPTSKEGRNLTTPLDPENASNGVGTGSNINIENPIELIQADGTKAKTDRSIIVGHELIHAFDNDQGVRDTRPSGLFDPQNAALTPLSNSEATTRKRENVLRMQRGLPLRQSPTSQPGAIRLDEVEIR